MPLTAAYRSLSRPSSASCAKASTVCAYHLLFDGLVRTHTLRPGPLAPGAIRCDLLEKRKLFVFVTLCGSQGTARASPRDRTLRAGRGERRPSAGPGGLARAPSPSREGVLPRKEVIQPHLPVRLPCYDFTPLTLHTFGASLAGWAGDFGCRRLGWCDGRCVQGPGTHSPRRADPRLLATPTSWRRVAASNPNWGRLWGFAPARAVAARCAGHCSTCAAQDIRGMMT